MNRPPEESSISAFKEEILNDFRLIKKQQEVSAPNLSLTSYLLKNYMKILIFKGIFRRQTICETLSLLLSTNLFIELA